MKKRKFSFIIILIVFSFIYFPCLYAEEANEGQSPTQEVRKKPPRDRNFCYECHLGLKKGLKNPCIESVNSVHSLESNQCNNCHGGNPNMFDAKEAKKQIYGFTGKPQKREIAPLCGQVGCHETAYFQFQKSSHYKSMTESGDPTCTTCHGTHNIKRSSRDEMTIDKCAGCHSIEYSAQILGSVSKIEKDFDDIQKNIDYLIKKNVDVWELTTKLSETKGIYYQLVHVFSQDLMDFSKRIIDLETQALQEDLIEKIGMLKRIDLLYQLTFITIALILGIVGSFTIRNIYRKRQKTKQAAEA